MYGDNPKYIIIEEDGFEYPIVFPAILNHSDIGRGRKVVAAGFCSFGIRDRRLCTSGSDISVSVWGESVTLGIKSRQEDAELISKHIAGD